jgi:hypothetical protein
MFENPTVNLNALCNSCAKIACCSSQLIFTFLYEGSSIQNASEQFVSCIQLSFVNFALHATTELCLEIQTALSRYPFRTRHMFIWTFLLIMTDTINLPKYWITLYMAVEKQSWARQYTNWRTVQFVSRQWCSFALCWESTPPLESTRPPGHFLRR